MWQYDQRCGDRRAAAQCYEIRDPLDLAVVAAALIGACFGFLWWNTSPAKIFMGDTGSLALGGALAGLAICSRTELLLVILGGLFVLITAVGGHPGRLVQADRQAGLPDGAAAAPLRALGWSEVLVVIRFWIIQACASPRARHLLRRVGGRVMTAGGEYTD